MNDLDAIRDVVLKQVAALRFTIDRLPMDGQLKRDLGTELDKFERGIDGATLAKRNVLLGQRRADAFAAMMLKATGKDR